MIDGGSAFPRVKEHRGPATIENGMSLRDWFAGQVLCSASALPLGVGDYEYRAKVAYAQADAMLAARDKEPQP